MDLDLFPDNLLKDAEILDAINSTLQPAITNIPEKPESHVIDFILQNYETRTQSIILTQHYPPERMAHTSQLFYDRALIDITNQLKQVEPYQTLTKAQIHYHFECMQVAYMTSNPNATTDHEPSPILHYFNLPLNDESIAKMPYPLLVPSSKGPQTRMKIFLKFFLSQNPTKQTNPADIFDQLSTLSSLITNITNQTRQINAPSPLMANPQSPPPWGKQAHQGFNWKKRKH
jgi:hypothetical protein